MLIHRDHRDKHFSTIGTEMVGYLLKSHIPFPLVVHVGCTPMPLVDTGVWIIMKVMLSRWWLWIYFVFSLPSLDYWMSLCSLQLSPSSSFLESNLWWQGARRCWSLRGNEPKSLNGHSEKLPSRIISWENHDFILY